MSNKKTAVRDALENLESMIMASAYGEDGVDCDWSEESVRRIEQIFAEVYKGLEKLK